MSCFANLFGIDDDERELLALYEQQERDLLEDIERDRVERMQEHAARNLLYGERCRVDAAPINPPLTGAQPVALSTARAQTTAGTPEAAGVPREHPHFDPSTTAAPGLGPEAA